MKLEKSGERPWPESSGKRLRFPSQSEMWMWHELPSRSSNFGMNVSACPCACAISFAPLR